MRVSVHAAALLGTLAAAHSASAALPVAQSISATPVLAGETMPVATHVTDADGNLNQVVLKVAPQGTASWTTVATVTISGSSDSRTINWAPSIGGTYTLRLEVRDATNGTGAAQRDVDVYSERRTISATRLKNGDVKLYTADGEIVTQQNLSGEEVVVESGAVGILWARQRVRLLPGFKATGSATGLFWAAVDRDLDGYSDIEEITDTDGDGMPDAWEVDHGFNPLWAGDAAQDFDGDGTTNVAEYQAGRNPRNSDDSRAIPGGFNLVLKTPSPGGNSFYGVNTTNWSIGSANVP